jgi:SAM-dependent methyltransferase
VSRPTIRNSAREAIYILMSGKEKRAFDPLRFFARLKRSVRKRVLFRKFGEVWNARSAFQNRSYDSYDAYLEHQKAKLETHDFANYDTEFRTALRERLAALDIVWQGRTVLCLAARIGTEVKAFLDLGCFAIGIDLNPGKENRFVVQGDFHDLQFAPQSVDVVYTNSLDHAFDIDRIAREILKVLKPEGLLIVEAVQGRDQGVNPGFFESFFWKNIDELIALFEAAGFKVTGRTPISHPWPGEAICFQPAAKL